MKLSSKIRNWKSLVFGNHTAIAFAREMGVTEKEMSDRDILKANAMTLVEAVYAYPDYCRRAAQYIDDHFGCVIDFTL